MFLFNYIFFFIILRMSPGRMVFGVVPNIIGKKKWFSTLYPIKRFSINLRPMKSGFRHDATVYCACLSVGLVAFGFG